MFRSVRWAVLCIALHGNAALACDTVSETRDDRAWTVLVGDDTWRLPAACDAAIAEVAALGLGARRQVVRIDTIIDGRLATSLALARIGAIASAIEQRLVLAGVPRQRIRISDFRLPATDSVGSHNGSRIIVRVGDR